MPTRTPRRLGALSFIAAGTIALAACGGGGSSSNGVASLDGKNASSSKSSDSKTSTKSTQQAFLDFAQCMRDHGVQMADPTFDANGRPQFQRPSGSTGTGGGAFNRDDPTTQAAQTACRPKLEGAFSQFQPNAAQQAQQRESLLKYAKCMREHGVDMADPTFGTDGRPQFGGGQGGTTGAGRDQFDALRNDPNYESASQACRQQLGGGAGGGGFGGPGGGFGGPPPGGGQGTQNGASQ